MQRGEEGCWWELIYVSILTGLERPVQRIPNRASVMQAPVSILTGLERPVQHEWLAGHATGHPVSILTGLERPVQRPKVLPPPGTPPGFNPHRP